MSKFTSGGTIDEPTQRDEAWLAAQREIDAKRREREDAGRASQAGGKSLFETLEANKAAKQEAFEESVRLKNQFRTLDDDEIGFLDSVLESTRAKEAAVRRETATELERFKREREQRERDAVDVDGTAIARDTSVAEARDVNWKTGGSRKRRRVGTVVQGIVRRESGSSEARPQSQSRSETRLSDQDRAVNEPVSAEGEGHGENDAAVTTGADVGEQHRLTRDDARLPPGNTAEHGESKTVEVASKNTPSGPAPKAGLGLDDYSSDDD